MHCKSLWIKASAKCINVNVHVILSSFSLPCLLLSINLPTTTYSPVLQHCTKTRGSCHVHETLQQNQRNITIKNSYVYMNLFGKRACIIDYVACTTQKWQLCDHLRYLTSCHSKLMTFFTTQKKTFWKTFEDKQHWSPLTFIIWTKNTETFFKISYFMLHKRN